jgi:hypothetical protein
LQRRERERERERESVDGASRAARDFH